MTVLHLIVLFVAMMIDIDMTKKIIYLAALSLLLSGCGDSDEPKKPLVDSMIMPSTS